MEFALTAIGALGTFLVTAALPALIIYVVGVLIINVLMKILEKILEKSKLDQAAYGLIKTAARTVMYVLLALIIASRLGIDVTGIVALASVLTLAISLSVQNLLTNLVSGFTLLYTKPFVAGDFVEIAGQSGTVLAIGLTYTKLATPDNKEAYIPNSSVTSAEIVNYTVLGTRRVEISVSAAYTEPIEGVLAALHEAAKVPTAIEEPGSMAAVQSYGESAINYTLHVWCKAEDYWTTLFAANANIKAVFDAKGIQMTYPHLNVHLDK